MSAKKLHTGIMGSRFLCCLVILSAINGFTWKHSSVRWSRRRRDTHRSLQVITSSSTSTQPTNKQITQTIVDDTLVSRHIPEEELSPYYKRDVRLLCSDCIPSENVNALQQLLEQRYHARSNREYSVTPQLDEQLLQLNVRVFDYPRIWTTLIHHIPPAQVRRRREHKQWVQRRRYGPTGHNYTYTKRQVNKSWSSFNETPEMTAQVTPKTQRPSLFSSVPTPFVHNHLAQLTYYRLQGRQEEADALEFELYVQGIHVDHENQTWRVNSVYEMTDCEDKETLHNKLDWLRAPNGLDYRQITDYSNINVNQLDLRDQQRIEQRLEQGLHALAIGDHRQAAILKWELMQTYKILINDTERSWRMTDDQDDTNDTSNTSLQRDKEIPHNIAVTDTPLFPALVFQWYKSSPYSSSSMYRESTHSFPLPDNKNIGARVHELILERIHKREEGKFLEADALRKELWVCYVSCLTLDSM